MKKILGTLLGFVLLCGMMLFTASCEKNGDNDKPKLSGTEISSKSMTLDGDKLSISLPNATETFSFLDDITVAKGASYTVATDINCSNTIASKTVEPKIGDNVFYILVTNGDDMKLYTVNVRRIGYYTVSFNTQGGTPIEPQTVEVGCLAEKPIDPTAELLGYVFTGWNFDFSTPITSDITVKAKFDVDNKMNNFEFTSTASTCDITGINDRTVTEIIIPDYVTSIGDFAFRNCSSLTSVKIGDSVTSISWGAFYSCSSLISVVIPDSVTRIGNYAFRYCSSLTSVKIGDSVTSIGASALSDCSSLTSIEVSENNGTYKSIDGNLYSKDGKTLIQYAIGKTATSFTIPDSVTSIGNYAFRNCSRLTSVVIPDSVTSIGDEAFYKCSSLTSVKIGDSVTSIGYSAFLHCDSLTSAEIGDSVKSIGDYAFGYCSNLTSVTFRVTEGWWLGATSSATSGTTLSAEDLANTSTAAQYLRDTYTYYYWFREA